MTKNSSIKNQPKQSRKWVAKTPRLAEIMKEARNQAGIDHERKEKLKVGIPLKKPSKANTPRKISSKRSAEICRAKFLIYEVLLEKANAQEISTIQSLHAAIEQTRNSLNELKTKLGMLQSTNPINCPADINLFQHEKLQNENDDIFSNIHSYKQPQEQNVNHDLFQNVQSTPFQNVDTNIVYPGSPTSSSSQDTLFSESSDGTVCENNRSIHDEIDAILTNPKACFQQSINNIPFSNCNNSHNQSELYDPVEDSPVSEVCDGQFVPQFDLGQDVLTNPLLIH